MIDVGDISSISDWDPNSKKLRFWLDVNYCVSKKKSDFPEQLGLSEAHRRIHLALLAMRLFAPGDVGSNMAEVAIGPAGWQKCGLRLDKNCTSTSEYGNTYCVSLSDRSSLDLAILADQLDVVTQEPSFLNPQLKVGIENFMNSYSKMPVDRLEDYLRCLQGVFSCTKSINLGALTAKVLAADETEYLEIERNVVESYQKVRNRATHGLEAPSALNSFAMKMIPYVEQYCRRAIMFLIALNRIGEMATVLDAARTANKIASRAIISKAQKKALTGFWSGRRISVKAKNGNEVYLKDW